MSLETVLLETKSVSVLNKYDTADGISNCILPELSQLPIAPSSCVPSLYFLIQVRHS